MNRGTFVGGGRGKKIDKEMNIDTQNMVLVEDVIKLQPEDFEFIELAKEAESFLKGHKWCKEVEKQWLAASWENLLAVFFFKIVPNSVDADEHVWVVVGDLPPAYIDIESAGNLTEAIQVYTEIMDDWVQHVKKGESIADCYPINVPPEKEYAEMLATRLNLIREHILNRNLTN